jgi:putative membrane protein
MNIRVFLASLAAATALASAVPAFAADTAQDFVDKAAVGGMFEVQTSKIAQDKAHDQSVKDFAAMMIHDHGAANAKLETIAGEQKLKVPAGLDAAHQSDLEKLQNTKDPLDPSYVKMQRDAHADAVKLFESFAKDGDNASLKTFAQETAPTLKMHQDKIEKIAAAMEAQPAASDATTPAVTTTDTPDASAPVPGANSFTEAQAKSRIEDAGYSDVSALAKDDKGIWRGQASKDGKSVSVALDFQGNVVAGTE